MFATNKLLINALKSWTHPMLTKRKDERAYVKVQVNRHPMNWLLDGGAQVSCLKTKFFLQFRKQTDIFYKPTKRLISANSGEFHAVMEAHLKLEIMGHKIIHTIYICPDLVSDGILGVDLMRRLGLTLDYSNNVVFSARDILARNCHSVSLLPKELKLVECKINLNPNFRENSVIVLESNANPDYLINPTLVKAPLVPTDTCFVLLCNLKPTTLHITRFQKIAWGHVILSTDVRDLTPLSTNLLRQSA